MCLQELDSRMVKANAASRELSICYMSVEILWKPVLPNLGGIASPLNTFRHVTILKPCYKDVSSKS